MYDVTWTEPALDQLADLHVQADHEARPVLELIVLRFNRELSEDPFNCGESRSDKIRVATSHPYWIYFTVNDPRPGSVRVLAIWKR